MQEKKKIIVKNNKMAVELQLPFCNFKKNMILEWRLKTLRWGKGKKVIM